MLYVMLYMLHVV